jgi:hypothetical protein
MPALNEISLHVFIYMEQDIYIYVYTIYTYMSRVHTHTHIYVFEKKSGIQNMPDTWLLLEEPGELQDSLFISGEIIC